MAGMSWICVTRGSDRLPDNITMDGLVVGFGAGND
jgi:hypothetical protein